MRRLLAATCLTPIALVSSASIAATTVSSDRSDNLLTSTIASGAADDISVTDAASLTPASGAAITIDSDNSVTNDGEITFEDIDNAAGIAANGGLAGSIDNSGTISLTESTTAEDEDDDGDDDGPFSTGTNRNGILIAAGSFTGDVTNSGTITIEGNDSAAIRIDADLVGSLTTSGTISVTGDNSYGILLQSVDGDVRIEGTTSVLGENAVGVALNGDLTGSFIVQGTVTATGYRSTSVSDTTDLDADDLLQGGPAVSIAGNVAGGVLFDAPPTDEDDTNDDEDGDGVDDADEGTSGIYSYGSAPAVQIGSADRAIAIGQVDGSDYGVVNKGVITAYGLYGTADATALAIGGLGETVTVAGGLSNAGSITATSPGGNAVGIHIGSGATMPSIVNSGTITTTGTSASAVSATAILIDAGASVTSFTNSGTITSSSTDAATVTDGVVDRSGTLTSLTNLGDITAGDTAIDLSANSTGVSIVQALSSEDDASAPTISGDVLTGSGNDSIVVSAGLVTGDVSTGAGNDSVALSGTTKLTGNLDLGDGDDSLSLAGTSRFIGTASFGTGSDSLTIDGGASFAGSIESSGGLAVSVNQGSLSLTGTPTVALSSLSIGSAGVVGITIDPVAGTSTRFDVSGTATIASGAALSLRVTSLVDDVQSFTVIDAASLVGGENLGVLTANVPYLFAGSVTTDEATGTATIALRRKTSSELGLSRSRASAYDAIYTALGTDADMAGSFAALTTQQSFQSAYGQMMPIEAGSLFETATQGARAAARAATDPDGPRISIGDTSIWLQQMAWRTKKSLDDTEPYEARGWGFGGGFDQKLGGFGTVGLSLTYLADEVAIPHNRNNLFANHFDLGAHWRGQWGGLAAFARGSVGHLAIRSTRYFSGALDGDAVDRTAKDKWNGLMVSGSTGLSWQAEIGRFAVRPSASLDYYRLNEKAHDESGGGTAFDLSFAARRSDELAANGLVTLGYALSRGDANGDALWTQFEIEGGWRHIFAGSVGDTVASYADGESFRLQGEDRTNGPVGRVRFTAGNDVFRFGGEVGAEHQQSRTALSARASVRVGL